MPACRSLSSAPAATSSAKMWSQFGIFYSFETEEARQAHLNGEIPPALAQVAPDLLAKDPDIRPVDLIAVK